MFRGTSSASTDGSDTGAAAPSDIHVSVRADIERGVACRPARGPMEGAPVTGRWARIRRSRLVGDLEGGGGEPPGSRATTSPYAHSARLESPEGDHRVGEGNRATPADRPVRTGVGLGCRPGPRWPVVGRCGHADVSSSLPQQSGAFLARIVLKHGRPAAVEVWIHRLAYRRTPAAGGGPPSCGSRWPTARRTPYQRAAHWRRSIPDPRLVDRTRPDQSTGRSALQRGSLNDHRRITTSRRRPHRGAGAV
jgi:hypothetical protein